MTAPDIQARLVEGGSRELDVAIARILEPETALLNHGWSYWTAENTRVESINPRPSSTSVDAALALAERVLGSKVDWAFYLNWAIRTDEPELEGGGWEATPETKRGAWVRVFGEPYELRNISAEGPTLAAALCIAILKAKALQDGRDG